MTHSGEGEGLLFYGNVILPFVDHFPTDLQLYKIMTTKLSEVQAAEHENERTGEKGPAEGMVRAERLPKQRTKEA